MGFVCRFECLCFCWFVCSRVCFFVCSFFVRLCFRVDVGCSALCLRVWGSAKEHGTEVQNLESMDRIRHERLSQSAQRDILALGSVGNARSYRRQHASVLNIACLRELFLVLLHVRLSSRCVIDERCMDSKAQRGLRRTSCRRG